MRKYYVLKIFKNGRDAEADERLFEHDYDAEEWAEYLYNQLTPEEQERYRDFTVYELEEEEEDE